MSSLRRWRQVGGGGPIHKWTGTAEEMEGTWEGFHDGQYGPLGNLKTADGKLTLAMPTVLYERMKQIKEGAEVKIEYLGKAKSKSSGKDFHNFCVYVGGEDDLIEAESATADDVPF